MRFGNINENTSQSTTGIKYRKTHEKSEEHGADMRQHQHGQHHRRESLGNDDGMETRRPSSPVTQLSRWCAGLQCNSSASDRISATGGSVASCVSTKSWWNPQCSLAEAASSNYSLDRHLIPFPVLPILTGVDPRGAIIVLRSIVLIPSKGILMNVPIARL